MAVSHVSVSQSERAIENGVLHVQEAADSFLSSEGSEGTRDGKTSI